MEEITALLVEDDPIAERIEVDILKAHFSRLDVASTGQEAIALCQSQAYHYIFIDISLPDMDGFTLSETLRQLPKTSSSQLVALSVHADDLHQQCAKDSGMLRFIRKPLTKLNFRNLLEATTTTAVK